MKRREFSTLAAFLAVAALSGPSQARGLAEYDLYGKYAYDKKVGSSSNHYIYELKAAHVVTYDCIEGESVTLRTGSWAWDLVGGTITMTFQIDRGEIAATKKPHTNTSVPLARTQVFVFRIVGRDLKVIKEPQGRKGYVGFSGAVFKKA